jgi:hypothetical protein
MKKTTLILATFITIGAGAIFSSCQTPAEKVEKAQDNVATAKQELKVEQKDSSMAAVKTANADEWKAFKATAELKINNNKIRIEELKQKMKTTSKTMEPVYEKRIDSLLQRNADLSTRMYNYEKGKTDWESFKSEFNHDLDGLGKALKEFTFDNKK